MKKFIFTIILLKLLFCVGLCGSGFNTLAPETLFKNNSIFYNVFECAEKIEEFTSNAFKKESAPSYEKIIRTGLRIFRGYAKYPEQNGFVNFLSKDGLNILKSFEQFNNKIINKSIVWVDEFEYFKTLIKKIPRPNTGHVKWNEDLFIDVFPGMSDEQIGFLRNIASNTITIQLSRKCSNGCIHCAAITKGRVLSRIDQMPAPVAIKIIRKLMKVFSGKEYEMPLLALYDKSDVTDYKDPVLEIDALPIMHFAVSLGFNVPSFTQGNNSSKKIFNDWLPEVISFHPFHMYAVNYIKEKLNNPNKDYSEIKKKIINAYINKFWDSTKFFDNFPEIKKSFYFIYNKGDFSSKPNVYFRKFYVDKESQNILSNDPKGKYALSVIGELMALQEEIYEEFINKFTKSKRSKVGGFSKGQVALQFIGTGAFFLKSLGVSDNTISELNRSVPSGLYQGFLMVTEADGRLSVIAPEYYKGIISCPFRKVSELFEQGSQNFKSFLLILKIIAIGKIDRSITKEPVYDYFISKMLNDSGFFSSISYETNEKCLSDYSKTFINFIKVFVLNDKDTYNLLISDSPEKNNILYEKLKDVPVPVKLEIFNVRPLRIPWLFINNIVHKKELRAITFKDIQPDTYYLRRFATSNFGSAFVPDLVTLEDHAVEYSCKNAA